MRRLVLRALMVFVGLATLAFYLLAASLLYALVRAVWAVRPPLPTLVASIVVATLLLAYVSYQVNTARILRSLRVWELPPARAADVYRRLATYSDEMGIDRPRLLVGDVGQPNAFALGGGFGRGTVVLDRRLFGLLTFDELTAILAHECAHIENRDSLVQTFGYSAVQTLSGLVMTLLLPVLFVTAGFARALAWMSGRPLAWERTVPGRVQRAVVGVVASLVFVLTLGLLALSRRREFAADDRAATVTGDPLALARALRKIERATGGPWELLSQLYVSGEEESRIQDLFSTHPDTDRRIERLRERAERDRRTRRVRLE